MTSLGRQRPILQPLQIEAIDFAQQFDKGRGAMSERRVALGGAGARRIADRSGQVQILRQPSEAGRPIGAAGTGVRRGGGGNTSGACLRPTGTSQPTPGSRSDRADQQA